MMRIQPLSFAIVVWALLSSTAVYGQVNWAVESNNELPEEIDGWDGEAMRIAFDGVGGSQTGFTFDSAVTGDYSKIEFDFEFRFLNDTPEGIADGIGWTYASVDVFGESAEDDIFPNHSGEEPNLEGSLGIGFDTWMNSAIDDPDAGGTYPDATLPNSFSLHFDGERLVTIPMAEYDLPDNWLETPSVKRAHIELEPRPNDEGAVTVVVTDTETGESVVAFQEEPIDFFEPYDGRMTFRARTGGEWADTDIDNVSVTLTEPDGTQQDPVVHYGRYVGGPDTGDPGDYNADGVLDAVDIDLQSAEMKKPEAEQNTDLFDHNGDNVVNIDDRSIWVTDLRGTWIGDSNFDNEFNSTDLVQVFAGGKYETGDMAGWELGDWDGDMVFGSGDLVFAFAGGGYEQGPPPAAAVPEPSSLVLVLLGLFAFGCRRCRK